MKIEDAHLIVFTCHPTKNKNARLFLYNPLFGFQISLLSFQVTINKGIDVAEFSLQTPQSFVFFTFFSLTNVRITFDDLCHIKCTVFFFSLLQ